MHIVFVAWHETTNKHSFVLVLAVAGAAHVVQPFVVCDRQPRGGVGPGIGLIHGLFAMIVV
eukprot:84065-Chlamydomonas_euryale.AAC.1